jgi:RimJ/RimL family protein N-acetyltransferase
LNALETERLRLVPWTEDDVAAFHSIWGDPEVIWWGASRDEAASGAKLREVIARCEASPPALGWRAVVERETGRTAGNVMLQPAPWAPHEVEVGWHLARWAWGRGFATEAAGALVLHAFRELDVPRVVAPIYVGNHRSRRVAERLRFARVGSLLHGGLPHDLFARHR